MVLVRDSRLFWYIIYVIYLRIIISLSKIVGESKIKYFYLLCQKLAFYCKFVLFQQVNRLIKSVCPTRGGLRKTHPTPKI